MGLNPQIPPPHTPPLILLSLRPPPVSQYQMVNKKYMIKLLNSLSYIFFTPGHYLRQIGLHLGTSCTPQIWEININTSLKKTNLVVTNMFIIMNDIDIDLIIPALISGQCVCLLWAHVIDCVENMCFNSTRGSLMFICCILVEVPTGPSVNNMTWPDLT